MREELVEQALSRGAERDVDAASVATATARAVKLLLLELQPLVGQLAAAALYRRGVHLARSSFQRPPDDASTQDSLLASLHHDLASRPASEAQKGARALLNSLVDLLVSLIGEALTYRLLRNAWGSEQVSYTPPRRSPSE